MLENENTCPKGHSGELVPQPSSKYMRCRACDREKWRRRKERNLAKGLTSEGKPRSSRGRGRTRSDPLKRFANSASYSPTCWEWLGVLSPLGYGIFWDGEASVRAHRWIYELTEGKIPEGHVLDHKCHTLSECNEGDNCPHRRCVNPAHLEVVTNAENVRRGRSISSYYRNRDSCSNGHKYEEGSHIVDSRGWRRCRICNRDEGKRRRARAKKAAA